MSVVRRCPQESLENLLKDIDRLVYLYSLSVGENFVAFPFVYIVCIARLSNTGLTKDVRPFKEAGEEVSSPILVFGEPYLLCHKNNECR